MIGIGVLAGADVNIALGVEALLGGGARLIESTAMIAARLYNNLFIWLNVVEPAQKVRISSQKKTWDSRRFNKNNALKPIQERSQQPTFEM